MNSKIKLRQLLPINSTVKLIGSQKDLYNRTLAEVVNLNDTLTNLKMMEEGLVAFYPYQKGCQDYRTAEAKAKKAKKGVWSDKNFMKPWDYRKKAVRTFLHSMIKEFIFIVFCSRVLDTEVGLLTRKIQQEDSIRQQANTTKIHQEDIIPRLASYQQQDLCQEPHKRTLL